MGYVEREHYNSSPKSSSQRSIQGAIGSSTRQVCATGEKPHVDAISLLKDRRTHLPCRDSKSLEDSKSTPTQTRTSFPPHPVFWCQDLLDASNSPQIPVSSPSAGCPLAHQVREFANQKAAALSLSVPKHPLTAPGMPSVSSWHTPKTVPKVHWMGDHHRKSKTYQKLPQNRSSKSSGIPTICSPQNLCFKEQQTARSKHM